MLATVPKLRQRCVLGLVFTLYLVSFPYFEQLNNPNEHVRLYMTMAIVEEGTYAIDGPTERFGWVNDRAVRAGRFYAGKAPGASFLGVPVYAVASWLSDEPLSRRDAIRWLRLFSVTFPNLLFLFLFRKFLDEICTRGWLKDAFFVAYAIGSMALAYGQMFAGHQLAAACLCGALIAFFGAARRLESGASGIRRRALLGGLLLGTAPAMEYPTVIASVIVGLYAVILLRHRPRMLAGAVGTALLPTALVLSFHARAFGSPFSFPYDFIENPAFQRLLEVGWHGSTVPQFSRLVTILAAPSFGIFFFTPVLLFAPIGWWVAASEWRHLPSSQKHLSWVLPAAALMLILYLSSSALWRAGWAVGPRYIASAIPLLTLAALAGAEKLMNRWPRVTSITVAILVSVAVVHSGTSGLLYPHQPEAFDNPVYDLNLRLITHGYAPHTLVEWFGITGFPALVFLGVFLCLSLVSLWMGPDCRFRHLATTLPFVVIILFVCSLFGHSTPAEERAWALIVRTWEPGDTIMAVENGPDENR